MQTSTIPTTGRIPAWIRVASLAPLGLFFAFVTLIALSLTGWGPGGMTVAEQLRSDAGVLGMAAVSGATAGSLLLLAFTGRASAAVLAGGAALGCIPVAIRLVAYVTDRF